MASELENGRLVRLLSKFGFINERPEFARDPRWSETGDRYIIKLFRDYVFHQVDEHGRPVINMSHVLTCLNKVSRIGSCLRSCSLIIDMRSSLTPALMNVSCLSLVMSRAVLLSAIVKSNHVSIQHLGQPFLVLFFK